VPIRRSCVCGFSPCTGSSRSTPQNRHSTRFFHHSLNNPSVTVPRMLPFRMFAKLQPGLFHSFHLRRLPRCALSLLFAAHTDSTSCKSFSCHSYENTGDTYQLFPLWNSPPSLLIYSFYFQRLPDSFAQWAAATPFLSILCRLFPLQWGVYPSFTQSGIRERPYHHRGPSPLEYRRLRPGWTDSRLSPVTSHQSRVTSHSLCNIQSFRGDPTWVTLCPCPSFQIVGRASVWEG
jgi:hypothetical protein